MQLMDGRKSTGGRLEVRVRLREPLGGQDHQTVTERWLVLEEPQVSANVAECSYLFLFYCTLAQIFWVITADG